MPKYIVTRRVVERYYYDIPFEVEADSEEDAITEASDEYYTGYFPARNYDLHDMDGDSWTEEVELVD